MNDEAYPREDPELAGLPDPAGTKRSPGELHDMICGIAAAPVSHDPGPALALVAPDLTPTSATRLLGLIEAEARRYEAQIEASHGRRPRIDALRAELARRGLDGFIVPRADEHQGEYVPRRAERLAWLTGFTGSAGSAAVLSGCAAIFVDGRYRLQVRREVDEDLLTPRHATEEPLAEWLAETLTAGQKLGYDPWLHTVGEVDKLRAACGRAGATLVACEDNPVDAVWPDQPPPPLAPVVPHDIARAGMAAADKRERMAAELTKTGAAAVVLTAPDSIAWLLNIRGGDVPHTPLPLGFAVLHADSSVEVFIDDRKLTPAARLHLEAEAALRPPEEFPLALDRLGQAGEKVVVGVTAPATVADRIEAAGGAVIHGDDPCVLAKACKNQVELAGTRAAHLRDGLALTRFLAWIADEAPKGQVDELSAAERLQAFRFEGADIRDLSFPTISAADANGAVVHYRAGPATNRRLEPGALYLVDSGAQYLDGTTDVTRTVAVGTPTAEQRDRFTRVLKGHIAIARARFPEGTTGAQIDALARQFLWRAGLDYDHGTGHGVGSYLGVHEGPHRISKLGGGQPLLAGMIVSNEPGYYKEGAWGIRIENLVVVVEVDDPDGAEKRLLGFETLTRAPIDLALVEPALMTADEIAWLDDYHKEVRESLSPELDAATASWLAGATRPLGRGANSS